MQYAGPGEEFKTGSSLRQPISHRGLSDAKILAKQPAKVEQQPFPARALAHLEPSAVAESNHQPRKPSGEGGRRASSAPPSSPSYGCRRPPPGTHLSGTQPLGSLSSFGLSPFTIDRGGRRSSCLPIFVRLHTTYPWSRARYLSSVGFAAAHHAPSIDHSDLRAALHGPSIHLGSFD